MSAWESGNSSMGPSFRDCRRAASLKDAALDSTGLFICLVPAYLCLGKHNLRVCVFFFIIHKYISAFLSFFSFLGGEYPT